MRYWSPQRWRRIRGLVVVAVVAVVVGAVVGIGLGSLTGDGDIATAGPTGPRAGPTTTSASPRTTAISPVPAASLRGSERPGVRVLSAVLLPAASPSGAARGRARLTVSVQLVNRATVPITTGQALLRTGRSTIKPDPGAAFAAGDLRGPIAPGRRATGVLRYETAGSMTATLRRRRAASLSFGTRSTTLRIVIDAS